MIPFWRREAGKGHGDDTRRFRDGEYSNPAPSTGENLTRSIRAPKILRSRLRSRPVADAMLRKMAHRRQTLGSRWQLVGHLLLLRRQIGLERLDPGLIALFVAISTATGGADKPLWPTPLKQERRAARLVRKARLKLAQRSRPSHPISLPPDADRRRKAPSLEGQQCRRSVFHRNSPPGRFR